MINRVVIKDLKRTKTSLCESYLPWYSGCVVVSLYGCINLLSTHRECNVEIWRKMLSTSPSSKAFLRLGYFTQPLDWFFDKTRPLVHIFPPLHYPRIEIQKVDTKSLRVMARNTERSVDGSWKLSESKSHLPLPWRICMPTTAKPS